jgi:hypothetical protein
MPAITLPYPLINGVYWEFGSIELKVGATPFRVTAVNYKSPLKPTAVYVNSPQKVGATIGREEPEADIEMTLPEANNLIAALQKLQPGVGYKLIRFDILVNMQAAGMPLLSDTLLGCRIVDIEASQAAGPDPLKRKIPLDVMRVLNFGQEPLTSPLPGS